MKKIKTLMILTASTLLLAGCGNKDNSSNNSDTKGDNTSSVVSSEDSGSTVPSADWSEKDKTLLNKYCGEVLPYPTKMGDSITLAEIADDYGVKYLEIYAKSKKLTITDYYQDLKEANWNVIYDYNNDAAQYDSYGNEYYEAVKVNGNVGYSVQYMYGEDSDGNGYNVIYCYNNLDVNLTTASNWTAQEKYAFDATVTNIPPMLKLGSEYEVYGYDDYCVIAYDNLAIDCTLDNVDILKNAGWTIDTKLSSLNGLYILSKTATDGTTLEATLYYNGGNYVMFDYVYQVYESVTWPTEFVAHFAEVSGVTIPEFSASDIKSYSFYQAKGEFVIYAETEDEDLIDNYEAKLKNMGAYYDSGLQQYLDWNETYYVKTKEDRDDDGNSIFQVSFAALSEPVDELLNSYPEEAVNEFLERNNMGGVVVPTFPSLINYTTKDKIHGYYQDYDEVYADAVQEITENYYWYGIDDPTDTEAIEALAAKMALEYTSYTISIYDAPVSDPFDEEAEATNEAFNYIADTLKDSDFFKVADGSYNLAYEDATGKVMIGVTLANEITTITFTYGTGKTHSEPKFVFDPNSVSVDAGDSIQLNLICEGVEGTIVYTSDNEKFTVDNNGLVTAASDATGEATITATITIKDTNETMTATAIVTVNETWTAQKTADAIASKFNDHFDLSEGDDDYAAPAVDQEGVYSLSLHSNEITTVTDAEDLFVTYLIPGSVFGDCNEGVWEEGTFDNGIAYESLDYVAYNEDDTEVDFTVYAYSQDGAIYLKLEITEC